MKVLIWIGCYIIATLLNVLLGMATGVRLGYLLFYLAFTFAARSLCKAWDQHKDNRNMKAYQRKMQNAEQKNASVQSPLPPVYTQNTTLKGGEWKCSCGRIHQKYVSACVCGKSKQDALSTWEETVQAAPQSPSVAKPVFCGKCGFRLLEDSRFCSRCGEPISMD